MLDDVFAPPILFLLVLLLYYTCILTTLNRFLLVLPAEDRRKSKMSFKRILAAFDFDHTIVDKNSDIVIQQLIPDGSIPDDTYAMHDKCWVDFMGALFKHMHSIGITKDNFATCLCSMELTSGMKELLEWLHENQAEIIIISDANMYFIETILTRKALLHTVSHIYTNPAYFDDSGCLRVSYYHNQDKCTLSGINLCKGEVMQQHVELRRQAGVHFDHVVYIGDGSNDLCPALRLESRDILCPRKGFALHNKLEHQATRSKIPARILPWNSGLDIQKDLREFLQHA